MVFEGTLYDAGLPVEVLAEDYTGRLMDHDCDAAASSSNDG